MILINVLELFRKIQSGYNEMKLEVAKELQNIFKSNLNEIFLIFRFRRFKLKEQKSALENIKLLYES